MQGVQEVTCWRSVCRFVSVRAEERAEICEGTGQDRSGGSKRSSKLGGGKRVGPAWFRCGLLVGAQGKAGIGGGGSSGRV